MEEGQTASVGKNWLRRHRRSLTILSLVFAVIISARLLLRSSWLLDKVRTKVVATADSSLNGSLTIRKLSGDLWTHLEAIDINVTHGDTLVHLDTLQISYSLPRNIIHPISISSIRLHGLDIFLKKDKAQTWNFQQLTTADTSKSSSGFPFSNINIGSFSLDRSQINILAPGLLPDSTITISNLSMQAAMRWLDGKYDFKLPLLSFDVTQPDLRKPLHLETKFNAQNHNYDLGRLLISGAKTMLSAKGLFQGDSASGRLSAQLEGKPISPAEIRAFYDQYPLKEDLNLQLEASGDLKHTRLTLNASSKHLNHIKIRTDLSVEPELVMHGLGLTIDDANFQALTGDTSLPKLAGMQLSVKGPVPLKNWQKLNVHADLSLNKLDAANIRIESANGTITADSSQADLHLNVHNGNGSAELVAHAEHPFDSLRADWNSTATLSKIDPSQWLAVNDTSLAGTDVSAIIKAKGAGWMPSGKPWHAELIAKPSQIKGQNISGADINASVTDSLIRSHGSLRVNKSSITLDGSCRYRNPVPTYQINLNGNRINLADVVGLKNYPTALYLALRLKGRRFSPRDMILDIRLTADSSIVNNERLSHMLLKASLQKQKVVIDTMSIKSSIADVDVNGHVLLNNLRSPSNTFHYDISLKDIRSLSPLLGVKTLQAKGDLLGDLSLQDSTMKFVTSYYLNHISYNEFTADELNGQMEIRLTNKPRYKIYTELKTPAVNGLTLRDFKLTTEGENSDHRFSGHYDVSLVAHPGTGSEQKGTYFVTPDSANLGIQSFYIETPNRRLSLNQPATIIYANKTIRSDSITLESPDSALINLHISKINQAVQQGSFKLQKCNLGAIQDLFLGQHYFDGTISGQSTVDIRADSVLTHTHILMHSLTYGSLELDTLRFNLDINHETLKANGMIRDKGITLMQGRLDCPFLLGNPAKFDTTFFNNQVQGDLKIDRVNLKKFAAELKDLGWNQASGTFSFNTTLSGKAGAPVLDGSLLLQNSQFSGVPIDSLKAGFTYKHPQHELHLFARLISKNQEALLARGQVPLYVDLHNFHITLPDSKDSLDADITSSDFNLQALNGFVMPEEIDNLQGLVNSKIHIGGTYGDPRAHGFLDVSDADVQVLPASIKLKNMAMNLALDSDSLVLKKLHMESGNGNLDVSGKINLNGLQPGKFDISTTSDNFQIFNNRNYKAAVSLDTKLKGTAAHPVLTGNVKIDHADVYPKQLSTNNVETVHLKPQNPDTTLAMYDSLRMDMKVVAPRNVWLRSHSSPEMAIELTGNLQLQKKPNKSIQVFGDLSSRQGYVTQLGKKFTLDTGDLTFNGDPGNPHLDIKTTYQLKQPSNISIYYMITGTLEKPQFSYDSDPKMDL
ncbi:MAG TPA: translocation/assembly module TamB domain-containing protein, partial [Balneolales bacterium]|nr:translocation/assembly module TamB domain-containing protein [Balneolales bacterium]